MVQLRVAHTADLSADDRGAIRALLYDVFDDLDETDYEHCLGGVHAMIEADDGTLLAHGSVVSRRLLHGGRALRTGYVEAVAVRAAQRRQGLGSAVMAELERVIGAAYELGALGASDDGLAFYRSRGWHLWPGTASVVAPEGTRRTPDEEGCILVLPGEAVPLDWTGDLACDWRDGDVW